MASIDAIMYLITHLVSSVLKFPWAVSQCVLVCVFPVYHLKGLLPLLDSDRSHLQYASRAALASADIQSVFSPVLCSVPIVTTLRSLAH